MLGCNLAGDQQHFPRVHETIEHCVCMYPGSGSRLTVEVVVVFSHSSEVADSCSKNGPFSDLHMTGHWAPDFLCSPTLNGDHIIMYYCICVWHIETTASTVFII